MKTQTTNLLAQLSKETLQELTTVVKETVASPTQVCNKKVFTSYDLWNIQKGRKNVSIRTFA